MDCTSAIASMTDILIRCSGHSSCLYYLATSPGCASMHSWLGSVALSRLQQTSIVTGKGETYRTIKLQPIVHALGPLKIAPLPSFHGLTGADNTGPFAKKGKPTCWNVFTEAHNDVIQALSQLGTNDLSGNETLEAVEKLVCQLFLSKTDICSLRALRRWLFTKKQARSQQLLPTQAALHQAVSVPTFSY